GRDVVGESAAAHRRRTGVAEAAGEDDRGIAGEGAVAHRRRRARPAVHAAAETGGVGGEGAAGHCRRPATLVFEAAPEDGDVAGEEDVLDRQRPEVVDAAAAAAEVCAGVAPGDCQAGDGHRLAGLDLENAGEVAAADGQLVGAGAVDLHGVGEV